MVHPHLRTFLHAQLVALDSIDRVLVVEIDIAQRIIDLIEHVFVLLILGHPLQLLHDLPVVAAGIDFCLADASGKLQLIGRIRAGNLLESLVSKAIQLQRRIDLSQQVAHPATLQTARLGLDSLLQVRDGFFELLVLHQIVGIDGGVVLLALRGDSVLVQLRENIFGFVEPVHLGVAAGLPELRLSHHQLVGRIVAGYVGERSGGLQEVRIVELRLAQQHPALLQEGVVLLLLLPLPLLRVVAPAGFLLGLRADGVQFDSLVALLNGAIEGAAGLRFVFRLRADGVHQNHVGIVLLVSRLLGFQGFIEGDLTIIIYIVAGCKGMIEAARPRILLRTARRKEGEYQK